MRGGAEYQRFFSRAPARSGPLWQILTAGARGPVGRGVPGPGGGPALTPPNPPRPLPDEKDSTPDTPGITFEVRERHCPVFLTRRGRRVAAVIDSEDLDRLLEAAEDLEDIEAARATRAEVSAQGSIPWDRVKADLGLI